MRHRHTLGLAGRARGVEHVGEVRLGHAGVCAGEVGVGFVRPLRAVGHHVQHAHGGRRAIQQFPPVVLHARLRQQHDGCAVLQGVGQAINRIGGVERHVGGAGLERCHQTDDHADPALDVDRNAVVRRHAGATQVVRKTVGAGIEFEVADAFAIAFDRDCGRRPRDLRLE